MAWTVGYIGVALARAYAFCEHWASSPFDLPAWVQQSGTWAAISGKGQAQWVPRGTALTNLLAVNQSTFEGGSVAGWEGKPNLDFAGSPPPVYTSIVADSTRTHSGSYAVQIGSFAGADRYFGTLAGTAGFAVQPYGTYTLNAWVNVSYNNFGSSWTLSVDWYDSSGTLLSRTTPASQLVPPVNTWTYTSWGTFVAPAGAAYAAIYGRTGGLNNTVTAIWLDDVVFKAVGPAPFGRGAWASARYPVGIGGIDLSVDVTHTNPLPRFTLGPLLTNGGQSCQAAYSTAAQHTAILFRQNIATGVITRYAQETLSSQFGSFGPLDVGAGYRVYAVVVSPLVNVDAPSYAAWDDPESPLWILKWYYTGNTVNSGQSSIIFAYDTSADTGFSLDYNGGTTVSLVQHNGATATTLATATVTAFTTASFNVIYNDATGTIKVFLNGAQIISVTLSTPAVTGQWAGLMSDTANADQWDEFCWSLL